MIFRNGSSTGLTLTGPTGSRGEELYTGYELAFLR